MTQFCADVGLDHCSMTFYRSQIADNLTGETAENSRASTESVFDEDLQGSIFSYDTLTGHVETGRIFALNRLNFDAAYQFLIPKAVNYSAGLINYFFRGRMNIALPSAEVYAIADQAAESCADNCGFRQVNMKVTNTTPNEAMATGTLIAVVKFHRNSFCYEPDFAGSPPALACRTSEDEIVVSRPVPLMSPLNSAEEREVAFAFDTPIPINATDVFLQVVFQGALGSEQGAVAIATKDISEPTFITTFNDTDYVALNDGCFKAEAIAADDKLWNQLIPSCRDTSGPMRKVSNYCANIPLNIRYSVGAAGNPIVVAMEQGVSGDNRLPSRRLGRFAVLTDASPPISLAVGFDNPPLYLPISGPNQFASYELEERLDGSRVEGIYATLRGINTWASLSFVVDGRTGAVGSCANSQIDALRDNERAPVQAAITE